MTKIITTIGPASTSYDVLDFFKHHSVQIGRLNFSHNTSRWHTETGELLKRHGLEIMLDLAGPKVLLGDLHQDLLVATGEEVIFEKQEISKSYPYWDSNEVILPTLFNLAEFVKPQAIILIDDGKLTLEVLEIIGKQVKAKVIHGGKIKNHKGINLPGTKVDIPFLVDRDRTMLKAVLPKLKPEYIAPSFVKTVDDLDILEAFLKEILEDSKITDYFPKICTKIEMSEAVEKDSLKQIIQRSDMIMIARGDLALETYPAHLEVPFLQEEIIQECRIQKTPFIIATQILESMFDSPVPTRAETSDLYRAIYLNQADFVMLSGESAAGNYPKQCVKLMHDMIYYKR